MNKFTLIITVLASSTLYICTSCNKEESLTSPYIEGLTIDNYPVIDGSTSTLPLNTIITCELLGLNYQWVENRQTEGYETTVWWSVEPEIKSNLKRTFDRCIKSSQTHHSFINLIDKEVDITITVRTMSPDEKAYAAAKGITLIETPIAIDAFIVIINPENQLYGLTTEEIQGIYTGKITDWKELGWGGLEAYPGYTQISPFIRDPNSGSQELMDLLIMKGLDYINLPIYEDNLIWTMMGMVNRIASDPYAIGYTVYYYNDRILRTGDNLKTIAIDGVYPNKQTISDRSYPYTAEVYAVIRSDTDRSSMAYKIYEWLQTEAGRKAISKSGYTLN